MMRALRLAGKDLRHNALTIPLFMAQFAVCLYFLFSMALYLGFASDAAAGASRLAAYEPVGLQARGSQVSINSNEATKKYLTNTLTFNGNAYAVIPSMLEVGDEVLPLYVGIGRFAQVFDLLPSGESAAKEPKLLIGSKIKGLEIGTRLSLGQIESNALMIAGRLKAGASFYEGLGKVTLDQSTVLLCDFAQFSEFLPWDAATMPITQVYLLQPSQEELNDLIRITQSGTGTELRPYNLGSALRDSAQSTRHWVAYYLSFYLCLLLMISLGMVSNLYQLIDSNMREYAIHRLLGASMSDLGLRTFVYVAILVLPPFLFFPLYLSRVVFPGMVRLDWIVIFSLAALLVFFALPMLRLRQQDASTFLRKDG